MQNYTTLRELEFKGKRVFVRVDFNVPLKRNGDNFEVADPTRIVGALDTIRYIADQGGKVILASHLGRPDGQPNKKYSLEPVGQALTELLGKEVVLTDDCIGDGPRSLAQRMRNGEVMLLENLRFHAGEEDNSVEFVNDLLQLCDVYVTDAFGALHRAHASTAGLPKLVPHKAIGLLVEKELQYLEPLRDNPKRPFGLIMGGAKVSDKIGVLEYFLPRVDKVFIGGAMAYAFLKAKGYPVGRSLCEPAQVQLATKILKGADARNVKVLLPIDHVVTVAFGDTKNVSTTKHADIFDDKMGMDIGPQTLELYRKELAGLETIFWNGPMGVFEEPVFATGTFELAKAIADTKALKLVGGGDSAAAIAKVGLTEKFDFISTGGGATLEYLEGKALPGLKALEKPRRRQQLEVEP
jgi:phosphoglycerate kinase